MVWFYCHHCNKEIENPIERKDNKGYTRYYCPECRKWISKRMMRAHQVVGEEREKGQYKFKIGENVILSGQDLKDAEDMINAGISENMQELMKLALRSLKLRFALGGGVGVESAAPEPTELLKKHVSQKLLMKQLKDLEKLESTEDYPPSSQAARQFVNQLKNNVNIETLSPREMLAHITTLKMLESLSGVNNGSNIKEEIRRLNEEYKKELEKLRSEMQWKNERAEIDRRFSDVLNIIKNSDNKDKTVELIEKLQKSWIDSFERTQNISAQAKKEIEEAKRRADEEREKRFEEKLNYLQQNLANVGGDDLGVKELAKGLFQDTAKKVFEQTKKSLEKAGSEPKESSLEVAQKLIGGVIDQIKEPLLKPLGEGLRERIARGGQPQIPPAGYEFVPENQFQAETSQVVSQPKPETSQVVSQPQPEVSTEQVEPSKVNNDEKNFDIEVVGG